MALTGKLAAGPFEGRVQSLSFSPGGERFASGSDDIHIWDARTGELAAGSFEGHIAPAGLVVFRLMASALSLARATQPSSSEMHARAGRSQVLSMSTWTG